MVYFFFNALCRNHCFALRSVWYNSYICKIGCDMQREQRVTIKKATTELAAAKLDEKEKEQQTRRRQKLLRRMASSDVQKGDSVLTCKGRLSSEGGSNAAGVGGRVMEVLASSTGSRRGYRPQKHAGRDAQDASKLVIEQGNEGLRKGNVSPRQQHAKRAPQPECQRSAQPEGNPSRGQAAVALIGR